MTLTVQCVECDAKWEKPCSYDWEPGTVSHTLCCTCFRTLKADLIRKRQTKEGFFACFATADDYCDQETCKYRRWCLT
jgi:hypothetical protein